MELMKRSQCDLEFINFLRDKLKLLWTSLLSMPLWIGSTPSINTMSPKLMNIQGNNRLKSPIDSNPRNPFLRTSKSFQNKSQGWVSTKSIMKSNPPRRTTRRSTSLNFKSKENILISMMKSKERKEFLPSEFTKRRETLRNKYVKSTSKKMMKSGKKPLCSGPPSWTRPTQTTWRLGLLTMKPQEYFSIYSANGIQEYSKYDKPATQAVYFSAEVAECSRLRPHPSVLLDLFEEAIGGIFNI